MTPETRRIGLRTQMDVVHAALDAQEACAIVVVAIRLDGTKLIMPCAPNMGRALVLQTLEDAAASLRQELEAARNN